MSDAPTVTMVDVDRLHTDPLNPRRINEREMERLKRSITEDPDFMRLRPILARPDGSIYAGNMRYEAAKALGWDAVPAIFTDDPEALLRARAVKDNTQFGEWVEEELAEYLTTLGDLNPDLDFGALGLDDNMVRTMGLETAAGLDEFLPTTTGYPSEDRPPMVAGMPTPADAGSHDSAENLPGDDKTQAMMNAAAGMGFDWRKGEADPRYHIPLYREDRLLQRLPDGLKTWAGADANIDDGVTRFLYNYSPNGTWRDVPLDRVILSFFTDDRFLVRWMDNPAYYVSRLVANHVSAAVEIDLSPFEGTPWILRAWVLYQSRWLARFMQEFGINVIPRICYPNATDMDQENQNELVVLGLPEHVPVMAFNAQTGGYFKGEERTRYLREAAGGLDWFFNESGHTVGQLLVYGAKMWGEMEQVAKVPSDTEVVALPSFLHMRSQLGLPWRDH
jgi:hypothetical protein